MVVFLALFHLGYVCVHCDPLQVSICDDFLCLFSHDPHCAHGHQTFCVFVHGLFHAFLVMQKGDGIVAQCALWFLPFAWPIF